MAKIFTALNKEIDRRENKHDGLKYFEKSLCLRQWKKTVKNGLFGRSGGTRTHGLQYPKLARYHLRYASKRKKLLNFVVVSYVVKLKIRLKAENGELDKAFSPH